MHRTKAVVQPAAGALAAVVLLMIRMPAERAGTSVVG